MGVVIPDGTKFRGIAAGVETAERGSRRKSASGEIYTIGDIITSVATEPSSVTGSENTLAHYDGDGNLGEAGEVTVNTDGDITSTADIEAANLTAATGDITSTAGTVSGKALNINTVQAAAPTSAGTAGTAGDIVMHGTTIYICTVSGAAASATWSSVDLTAV